MKIVLPGGTGHIGGLLARALGDQGHEVVVLSRRPGHVWWDGRTQGAWSSEIDGADAVVNLAGRSVNCRYTPANLREMMDSRVDSTRAVGEAIANAGSPPRTWLQMSTATIYAHTFGPPNDEATGVIGGPSRTSRATGSTASVSRRRGRRSSARRPRRTPARWRCARRS